MKLGELRGAIRKFKGNPILNLYPIENSDMGMRVSIQKTSLLAELERIYKGGKAVETGLVFDTETGVLSCPSHDIAEGLSQEEKAAAFAGSEISTAKNSDGIELDDLGAEDDALDLDGDDSLDLDDDDILDLD